MSILLLLVPSATAQTIRPKAVPSSTGVVPGPRITVAGGPVVPFAPRVTAGAYSRAGVLLADLDLARGHAWQDVDNDCGTGSLVLANGDPDLALIPYGSVLRFRLDGGAVFASLVETKERATVASGEEADQETKVAGRGTLAVFEEAVVEPILGTDRPVFSDVRFWNFASPDVSVAGWQQAVGNPVSDFGPPEGWTDDAAEWIWDRYGAAYNPVNGPPLGDVYFRRVFTVATRVVAEAWAAADDEYEVWLDGLPILSDGLVVGYQGQSRSVQVELDAGTHWLAARASNIFPNRSGFRFTLFELGSDPLGVPVGVIIRSDASWIQTGYPPQPPGFTPGEILRVLLEEAQARGALTGVTLFFTDNTDSLGVPWPITSDVVMSVGEDYLSVIKRLCETYIDVWMAPGSLSLFAYVSRGTPSGVTLSPQVNLTSLDHAGSV